MNQAFEPACTPIAPPWEAPQVIPAQLRRVRDIEREFSITRSTVTNILQLMERKGYITRQSVEQDARLKQLVLTEKGRQFHEDTMRAFHQTDEYVAGLLTEEENTELLRLLNKLYLGLK